MMRRALLWPGPVEAGARAVAARHLAAAERAFARFTAGTDAEALHDFRVALRRLRSCMRAYREHLDPDVTPAALEHAGDLAARTGVARDAEVQIAWLERPRHGRSAARRAAAELLLRDLEALVRRSQLALSSGLAPDFAVLVGELGPVLSSYSAPVSIHGPPRGLSFGEVSAELLRGASAQLCLALARVGSERDDEPAHRARIEAKRVRYLLEPLEGEVRGVGAAIRRMRRLQDLLGELNDLRVLRASVACALERTALAGAQHRLAALEADGAADRGSDRTIEVGLLSLARGIHARRRALFARFVGQWLGEAATERAALGADIDALTERLASRKSG